MLMPAFHRFPKEAAAIGRMLVGYGELEFMLAICAGKAIGNPEIGLKTIFRIQNLTGRIRIADAIIRPSLAKAKLTGKYADAFGAINRCRKIRNQYAHCHWIDDAKAGLFFANLETSALPPTGFKYDWLHVDLPLLEKQEAYFQYAIECLNHMAGEYDVISGRLKSHASPMPKKQRPPSPHNPRTKHKAPTQGSGP